MYQSLSMDLSNRDMSGKLRQDLGYIRFRRVVSKQGKSVFYLFFQREVDTYKALDKAKKMKNISLVRYRHRNPALPPPAHVDEFPCEEISYAPFHPNNYSSIFCCSSGTCV
jgi:hypothetical protein